MESAEIKIAKMETKFDSFAKSFDEFKNDTKEFHKTQTQKLEEMATAWQEMGGLMKGLADLQAQVNRNTEFRTKYDELLATVKEEREDRKKRITDIAWKYGQWIIITVITIYVIISNKVQSITVSEEQAVAFFSAIKDAEDQR